MSVSRIIEDRIRTLQSIPETSGNETVIPLIVEYLENLKDEILFEGDFELESTASEKRIELEQRVENLKLVPLPW